MFTREDLLKESHKWEVIKSKHGKVIIPSIKGLYTVGRIPLCIKENAIIGVCEYHKKKEYADALVGYCDLDNYVSVTFFILNNNGKIYKKYFVRFHINGYSYRNESCKYNKEFISWVDNYISNLNVTTEKENINGDIYNPFIFKEAKGNIVLDFCNPAESNITFKEDENIYKDFNLSLKVKGRELLDNGLVSVDEYKVDILEEVYKSETNPIKLINDRLKTIDTIQKYKFVEDNKKIKKINVSYGHYRLYNKQPKYLSVKDVLKVLRFDKDSGNYISVEPRRKGFKILNGDIVYRNSIRGLEIELVTDIGFRYLFKDWLVKYHDLVLEKFFLEDILNNYSEYLK